jgi:hypothetical protein
MLISWKLVVLLRYGSLEGVGGRTINKIFQPVAGNAISIRESLVDAIMLGTHFI